ncbi:MAG: electron transfer flavoprotein subunit beta/FixA family protein [Fidelibacterota bacterium]
MKIGVLVKQVPGSESPIPINAKGDWVQEENITYVMNESDSYALEEAIQIKEKSGAGEVVVLSLGPQGRTVKTIREALAKGADRAIHIVDDVPGLVDPFLIAKALAKACEEEEFDLILSGLISADYGSGQVGIMLGEMLGLATASLAVETQVQDTSIRIKRELEGGWFQWLTCPLPALVTIQSGLNQPRYASLKGIMTAKRKEIKSIPMAELIGGLVPQQTLQQLAIPSTTKHTEMIEGETNQVVEQLIDVLKTKAKVL